jgi:hypothetical protein
VVLKVAALDHITHQAAAAVQAAAVPTELLGKVVKVAAAPIMQYFLAILEQVVLAVNKLIIVIQHLGGIKVDTVADTEHKIVLRAVQALLILEQVVVVVGFRPTVQEVQEEVVL